MIVNIYGTASRLKTGSFVPLRASHGILLRCDVDGVDGVDGDGVNGDYTASNLKNRTKTERVFHRFSTGLTGVECIK